MRTNVLIGALVVLTLAVIGVAGYAFASIGSLNDDLDKARAEVAGLKADVGKDMKTVQADVRSVELDVDSLEETADEQEEKANVAAKAKKRVERAIAKDRLAQLQRAWQVSDWDVGCVVATSNTLNCIGEGFLDGEESKESYEVTVDEDGRFVWKQTY